MKEKKVEAIVARAASFIKKLKETSDREVIVSHSINPIVNMEVETVAIAVGLVLNKKYDYQDNFFDAILRSLKAESYEISARHNILKVTFRVEE